MADARRKRGKGAIPGKCYVAANIEPVPVAPSGYEAMEKPSSLEQSEGCLLF